MSISPRQVRQGWLATDTSPALAHVRRSNPVVHLAIRLGIRVSTRVLLLAVLVVVLTSRPVYAATPDLTTVLNNLRLWITGVLATLATLFLSIGGLMYLTAAGNPRRVEQAKEAIRSAMIGFVFAGLAPLLITIIQHLTGL
ncbi:MAG: pilin [Solirubrobacteraceae bacterium]